MATKRTVSGDGTAISNFTNSESVMSETVKIALGTASYSGELVDKYELLDNSYRATGGFATGEYLIPHPSERAEKYLRRKNLSYYVNYVKPIVDAQVFPIFKSEPVREGTNALYELFIDNVDGNDTTLTQFMKKAAIRAKLHGVEFIVVDMERVDGMVTERDMVDNRLYPYLYLVSPAQITDWATDKFGKLIYISYSVTNTIITDDGDKKSVKEIYTWTETVCKKSVDDEEEVFENKLGIIPIIPIYGCSNNSDDLIPQSDVYAIAKTNFAVFNALSELRERNRNQAFSILTYPVSEDDDYESGIDTMQYGTADCILYRATTNANRPDFITPPAGPSETIMNEINFMIQEIYRMASLKMLTSTNEYNVTGVAKKYENQQLYQSIGELAQNLQDAEFKIARVFGKYVGNSLDNIVVMYNNEFGVEDASETLADATTALAMNICPEFNLEVKKRVIHAVLQDTDNNLVESVISSLENDSTARNPVTDVSAVQPTVNN